MQRSFDYDDIKHQFLDFLNSLGIQPYDEQDIVIDGELHRYRIHDEKSYKQSGAYCIYPEGLPAGFAQDWRKGIKETWRYDTSGLDDERKTYFNSEEFKQKAEQERLEADERRKREKLSRSEAARQLWDTLQAVPSNHPYLKAKHIQNYGFRYNPYLKAIGVPLRDISGRIMSIQWIPDDLTQHKTFYKGASLDGAFWSAGLFTLEHDYAGVILLGEGMATMAKVHELTDLPCVAAMSCYRLLEIAVILNNEYPNCKIIICADNDLGTEQEHGYNPGLREAMSVVKKALAHAVIYPEFVSAEDGSDWDDFAIKHRDKKTTAVLKEKIALACMSEAEKAEYNATKQLAAIAMELDTNIQLPPEDYIAGIFPRGRICAVVAPPGTGKTWFMQRTVSDLSCGGAVFDGFVREKSPLVSVVFAGEAEPELMIRRATDTKWPVNKDKVHIYGMVKAEKQGLSIMLDEDDGKKNIERIIKLHKPDIVFFDTFGSFHNSDENKADEMKPILRWLLTIAEVYNTAIVLMHHSRKMQGKEIGRDLTQDDVIGSSIFNRLVSVIVCLQPLKEENNVKKILVKSIKSWFSEFMPFTYQLTDGNDGRTVMVIDLAPKEVSDINKTQFELWVCIQQNYEPDEWFKASEIHQALGNSITLRQVQRYLSAFVASKKLRKRGDNRTTEYSVIPLRD